MRYFFITLFALFISTTSNANIYKCKQADGSIKYSGMPCPKNTKSQSISTLKKTAKSGSRKLKIIPFDQIETASDGLSQIRKDGFGNIKLSDLKAQLKAGKSITKKIQFFKNEFWKHSLEITGDPDTNSIIFYYFVSGMNYDLYDNPAKEREFNENDQSTHFNVIAEDINQHAISIGLKGKNKAAAHHVLTWNWDYEGFKCELRATVKAGISPHQIGQACTYDDK